MAENAAACFAKRCRLFSRIRSSEPAAELLAVRSADEAFENFIFPSSFFALPDIIEHMWNARWPPQEEASCEGRMNAPKGINQQNNANVTNAEKILFMGADYSTKRYNGEYETDLRPL